MARRPRLLFWEKSGVIRYTKRKIQKTSTESDEIFAIVYIFENPQWTKNGSAPLPDVFICHWQFFSHWCEKHLLKLGQT